MNFNSEYEAYLFHDGYLDYYVLEPIFFRLIFLTNRMTVLVLTDVLFGS